MSDGPQEYEVESVTRARVHDKRGKKITWRYYVKWKGYGWDESTWEPTDSFQGGSEHILESFWERMDTGGRDISDATAFKKGEELLISGPPARRGSKRKINIAETQTLSSSEDTLGTNVVAISAPLPSPRKRRQVQVTAGDEWGYSKRRVSTRVASKNGGGSARPSKRRRVSSPGPRKAAPKRFPSAGDSQLDADGETDPDVVEVEDELMQVSTEGTEGVVTTETGHLATASGSTNGSKKIAFDDLEHFYSGNPIDIDHNTDEQVVQNPEARLRPQPLPPTIFPSPVDGVSESQAPTSPVLSSPDPLFDSPSHFPGEVPEIQNDSSLPHRRARDVKPLVKFIDTTLPDTTSKQSRITTKARLMSVSVGEAPASGPSRSFARRGGKPGPGRSSSGLIAKNRSSLLTVNKKGALQSVKGTFTGTTSERDQHNETEEAPAVHNTTKGWSDADAGHGHQAASNSQPVHPPSGDELLQLAGPQTDPEALPDYEEDCATQPQETRETQEIKSTSAPTEGLPNQSLVEVIEDCKASDHVVDTSLSTLEARQRTSTPVVDDHPVPSAPTPPVDGTMEKSIELAKEHLFPSTQAPFNSFSTVQSSFRSTIFGPLYQGSTANSIPVAKNGFSTSFKVIFGDGVELPLVLEDCNEIKAQVSDILVSSFTGNKVALFYSAEDALSMVSTLKGDGTARVVLDPSAEAVQQERFSDFMQRFELSQTLIAPVGKEVCILYSSTSTDIADRLRAPTYLRGCASTLLISHASIENQLAYVAAIMKATAL